MAKRQSSQQQVDEGGANDKFRTTPIAATITHVKSLPKSAIIYQCEASQYWQFRVFMDGKQRKRTTKEADKTKALQAARLIFGQMLQNANEGPHTTQPSSRHSLQTVATALFAEQERRVRRGELHVMKNKNNRYCWDKHIRPFFREMDVKNINTAALEAFRDHLADLGLKPATQMHYLHFVMLLLKEAYKRGFIHTIPIKPKLRVVDEARGYFTSTEYTRLWHKAKHSVGDTYEFKSQDGKAYRKTRITEDCFELIMFMRHTYVRPTDIRLIRHRDVHKIVRGDITFIELRHGTTKRHSNYMASTEYAWEHYEKMRQRHQQLGFGRHNDYVFTPHIANRNTALDNLTHQFTAILEMTGLKTDAEGKPRTLYSLRHTAIVAAIRQGIPISVIAPNARTSVEMINRFYGSHIKSALEMGTIMTDVVQAKRERYAKRAEKTAAESDKPIKTT